MDTRLLRRIHLAARAVLAFVFIYHGLVPKILWLSPIETALTSIHGVDPTVLSPLAGGMEIVLGVALLAWRGSLVPVYAALLLLFGLLLDVMIVMPGLLAEAFNPLTTNVAAMFAGYVVIVTQRHANAHRHWA
ncbi:DoxX family membrane protein [Massilia sp. Dwa41.01b]|uniref:DoxX-like family protein n=1 Tax=unclassified Massilia TaxID=2609279 RepID=UPI0016031B11|nr:MULTISPECIES: DoxX-like family protein [unclassified Massilia]QNA87545.1 DoxX family membrane protein [Massilia sp. Dwa41.01b]QNA98456.1 DoxX family membrane protein [Massilia sp. Se16.2.3]